MTIKSTMQRLGIADNLNSHVGSLIFVSLCRRVVHLLPNPLVFSIVLSAAPNGQSMGNRYSTVSLAEVPPLCAVKTDALFHEAKIFSKMRLSMNNGIEKKISNAHGVYIALWHLQIRRLTCPLKLIFLGNLTERSRQPWKAQTPCLTARACD